MNINDNKRIRYILEEFLGKENVVDDQKLLDFFSSDGSIKSKSLPDLIVTPTKIEQIQKITQICNENKINLIPSSSTEKYYGATIPEDGGIILDLRKMNKILEIDVDERYVRIEPGVTFRQLQTEIKKYGLRIMVPLGLPSSASVVSTYIERVPLLSGPKILLSEGWQCILNMQIVIPNGMITNTGSASWCKERPSFLPSGPVSGPDLSRLFTGSQGTLGIITDLIIKAKYLPKIKRLVFIPYEKIKEVEEIIYQIQYYDKGREFLAISRKNLAAILTENPDQINDIRQKLPKWLIVIGIEADTEEKYQIDLADLKDFGAKFQTEYKIDGIELNQLFLEEFEIPERLNNFRKYKKNCLHIPFYVELNKISIFDELAEKIAIKYNYPIDDLYGYLMPIEQAHTCYYDFNIHFDGKDQSEIDRMKSFFLELSEEVINNGGVIDRPYGPWGKMIFSKNMTYYNFWRQVKRIVDPNEIMNPGQLVI
ncbi:MAG: FAD-binding oxidoreductase [Candidatus Lokiarchaeota archaeon]|nr:FAD-binding oxidoreductase [Candidatus Lokiarchaeota archaeon]